MSPDPYFTLEIVTEDGLLFGDDYSWDGVRLALNRFAKEESRQISFVADKWAAEKAAKPCSVCRSLS